MSADTLYILITGSGCMGSFSKRCEVLEGLKGSFVLGTDQVVAMYAAAFGASDVYPNIRDIPTSSGRTVHLVRPELDPNELKARRQPRV